jgi:uncharacterized protein YndB with AHSA1/START domain
MNTKTNLEVRRYIPAKPEKVFEAWTRGELMTWCCPEGMQVISAEAELKVRGKYRVSMKAANGQVYTFDGTYEEIVPDRKLVFTHQWEEAEPVETRVTVEFAEANGGTELTIKHDDIATEELAEGHEAGWISMLQNLANQFSKPPEGARTLEHPGLARPSVGDPIGPERW